MKAFFLHATILGAGWVVVGERVCFVVLRSIQRGVRYERSVRFDLRCLVTSHTGDHTILLLIGPSKDYSTETV